MIQECMVHLLPNLVPPLHGQTVVIAVPGIRRRIRQGILPAHCIVFGNLLGPHSFVLILTPWEMSTSEMSTGQLSLMLTKCVKAHDGITWGAVAASVRALVRASRAVVTGLVVRYGFGMDRALTSLQIWKYSSVWTCTNFLYFYKANGMFNLLHTVTVVLSCAVLHQSCHLLGYRRQVGGLFPAGYIQRLSCTAATGCLVFNVGLNELCGGIWYGLIRAWRISSRARIAEVGVAECFNLSELVGEVDVAVYGGLRTKLSSLFVFWMVSIVCYAVSWGGETKQHMNKAIKWGAVNLQAMLRGVGVLSVTQAVFQMLLYELWGVLFFGFSTNLVGCMLSCCCHWCRCHYCSSWCCSLYDWHMHLASCLAATAGLEARPCWEGQVCNKEDHSTINPRLLTFFIRKKWAESMQWMQRWT